MAAGYAPDVRLIEPDVFEGSLGGDLLGLLDVGEAGLLTAGHRACSVSDGRLV